MALLDQFLAEEWTSDAEKILAEAIADTGKLRAQFHFNRFDITVERAANTVVVEDVLDATERGAQTVPLPEFISALKRRAADHVHEWRRLAASDDPRIQAIASRLVLDARVHPFFPYASHHDLHISRTAEFPWDDAGLPYITSRPDDAGVYLAKDGDGVPRLEAGIESVVECFLSLLTTVRVA